MYYWELMKKLKKKLSKIEKKFETAKPLRKHRLMKMYLSTEKKLNELRGI